MIVALLMAAATQSATPPPAPPPDQPPAAAAKPTNDVVENETVCRYEQVVGSRFKKKICRTRLEMEARKRDDQMRLRMQTRTWGVNGS